MSFLRNTMDEFCGSTFWDTNITWTTNVPDFTPCFKETILIWIPCAFLILFTPLEICNIIHNKYGSIPWSLMNRVRLIISLILIAISGYGLSRGFLDWNLVKIVMASLKIFTFIISVILQLLQKKHGIVTSGVQFLFWTMLTCLAIPQLVSEIINISTVDNNFELHPDGRPEIYFLYFLCIFLQMILHCFADKPPVASEWTYDKFNAAVHLNCEQKSSFLMKIAYGWFEPITWQGYRRPLTIDDVHELNREYKTGEVWIPFWKYWQMSIGRRTGEAEMDQLKKDNNDRKTNVSLQKTNVHISMNSFFD